MTAPGRMLGIDVGSKRIGIAVSDELGLIASPVGMVPRGAQSGREIRAHAQRLGVTQLVVGLPVGLSGREGPQSEDVRQFIDTIAAEVDLPVEWWDERLSTTIAERSLIASGARRDKRKQQVDAVAASVILQGYLDSQQWKTGRRRQGS